MNNYKFKKKKDTVKKDYARVVYNKKNRLITTYPGKLIKYSLQLQESFCQQVFQNSVNGLGFQKRL